MPLAHRLLQRVVAGLAAAALVACQATPVAVPRGEAPALRTASFGLDAVSSARERLSGSRVRDFGASLIGAPTRWAKPGRQLQALGEDGTGAAAKWTHTDAKLGLPLSVFGCAATDLATNGAATRSNIHDTSAPDRVFVVTKNGQFLSLDPADPKTGYQRLDLTTIAGAATFSRTYVSLSGDGEVAFVVSDQGRAYAIDIAAATLSAAGVKSIALGQGTCTGTACFVDPLQSATFTPQSRVYLVANNGMACRCDFDWGGSFAGSTFTLGASFRVVQSYFTKGVDGSTTLVKSAPIALGGVVVVGDRRGYLDVYDPSQATPLSSYPTNTGWPIETPVAVDVNDNLAITDVFVPAGPQLYWVKPATGEIYPGQYALVENKGATSGTISSDPAVLANYLTTGTTLPLAVDNGTYKAFSLYQHPLTDQVVIPGTASYKDLNRLTHSEAMTGLPPQIDAFIGPSGRTYTNFEAWSSYSPPVPITNNQPQVMPPVTDGTPLMSANLAGSTAIDVMDDGTTFPADDGSIFIGDTNHCQVLFKPAFANSGQKWASSGPLAGSLDPNKVYVFAGTLGLSSPWSAADIGNGAGGALNVRPASRNATGAVARGTSMNLVFGVAVGNLGLYVSNLNKGALKDGSVLFIPRVGVTSAWGMTGLQAGRMYVLTTQFNPQGLAVDRSYATNRDVVYAASFDWSGASNRNRIIKLDSSAPVSPDFEIYAGTGNTAATSPDGTARLSADLNRPVDVGLDDYGNLFMAESSRPAISMIWNTRNLPAASNPRLWGKPGPLVTGGYYRIDTTLSQPQTVSFAVNDPQVPSGCLYVGATGSHVISRIDTSGAIQIAAGKLNTAGDTGDGTPATAARLNFPHRARGDGQGNTYVCDRYNNRIRKLTSKPDSGQSAGYMRFNLTSIAAKALYSGTLKLYSRSASGTLGAPTVGLSPPYLAGTETEWTDANVTPMKAPGLDSEVGPATPAATTWTYTANGGPYSYTLPAAAIPTGTSTVGKILRLGMLPPSDARTYYYPTSIGIPSGSDESPEFHTAASSATQMPTVELKYGTYGIFRPILSPPSVWAPLTGGKRYVYVNNANALFRYDVSSVNDFRSSANGGIVSFTLSQAGRAANGTIYAHATPAGAQNCFQPNATAPLVNYDGRVFMLDVTANSATNFSYTLNAFDGTSAGANMWLNSTSTVAASATSGTTSYDVNAGIYMVSSGYFVQEAYFGLANNRLYRVKLY